VSSRVIVIDKLASSLIGQAWKEGLLIADKDYPISTRGSRSVQDALSLLVLFDQVLLPVEYREVLDIPFLREHGVLETCPYNLGPTHHTSNTPLLETLEDYEWVEPLVLNKLMSNRYKNRGEEFDSLMADAVQVSRRALYHLIIRYAIAFYGQDEKSVRENPLYNVLPSDLREQLLDRPLRERSIVYYTDRAMDIVAGALLAIGQITSIINISLQNNAALASREYAGSSAGWSRMNLPIEEAQSIARSFYLVRAAINEEGRYFPRIESIKHAIELRKDPNLQSFKQQLQLFNTYLALGDRDAITKLREEVKTAKEVLERSGRWTNSLRWVTYFALPVSLAESLITGLPVLSSALSLYQILITAREHLGRHKFGWVLFGCKQ
jgi:hypothetical protein